MSDNVTRRAALSAALPLVAAGTATASGQDHAPSGPTIGADIFRPVIARWRATRDRRLVAESDMLANPDHDGPLYQAFARLDSELIAIERRLRDLTAATVGFTPAAVQVDDVIVSVATLAGDPAEPMVSIVESGRITRAL